MHYKGKNRRRVERIEGSVELGWIGSEEINLVRV